MTPDRFARMVEQSSWKDEMGDPCLYSSEAIALLRRQHAAMVRIVKIRTVENLKWKPQTTIGNAIKVSMAQEWNDLLATIAAYKKGTR